MVCGATGTLYVYTRRGEPRALAQVLEIKTLIYTEVALAFPRDGGRILRGRKIHKAYRN